MIYAYRCTNCLAAWDVIKSLADIDRGESCPTCSSDFTYRRVTAAAVVGDFSAYDCPITGVRIEGRKQHYENLRKHNCRILEPGEVAHNEQRKAEAEASLESSVVKQVGEVIAAMPAEKVEQLKTAASHGLDVQFQRG